MCARQGGLGLMPCLQCINDVGLARVILTTFHHLKEGARASSYLLSKLIEFSISWWLLFVAVFGGRRLALSE